VTSYAEKEALRRTILQRRRQTLADDQRRRGRRLCERVLALPEVEAASVAAAYRTLPGEPDTGPLLAAFRAAAVAVLLPVRQADNSLRWQPLDATNEGRGAIDASWSAETGSLLSRVDVVICPGVAGDLHGHRLGRGGGSYDRMLAHLPPSVLRVLLLHDDEVMDAVPVEPHDEPVNLIVTPTRTLRTEFRPADAR
jgi:5-formyltetrahydrofolate cyclo-ligase